MNYNITKKDFVKTPIVNRIDKKVVFYLNIFEPFRGTSKLRGIQIYEELLNNNIDAVWIPSIHGHQLNRKLDINIFEHIYNSIIIFIKYPVIDFKIGVNVLTMLKKNNNKLIYDFCDTNLNTSFIKETINFYDKILFMDKFTLKKITNILPVIKNKTEFIEHHYDINIDNRPINNIKTKNPKIYYFGNLGKTLLGNSLKSLGVLCDICWNKNYIDNSIAHICLRTRICPISHLKIGNCVAMNSVPIINKGIYDNYFDDNYPYILKIINVNELKKLIDKIKFDYINNTPDWEKAINYSKIIKEKLSIKNIIKKYKNLINF